MRAAPPRQALEEAMYSREEMRAMVTTMMRERSRARRARARSSRSASSAASATPTTRVKEVVVDELSDVGSRSLGDTKMQAQAQQVTIQTLNALLEDEGTQQRAATFVAAVAQPAARQALVGALVDALKSRPVLDEALALTKACSARPPGHAREKLVDATCRAALASASCRAPAPSARGGSSATRCAPRWAPRSTARRSRCSRTRRCATSRRSSSSRSSSSPTCAAKTSERIWGAIKGALHRAAARRARGASRPPPAASRRKPRRWRRRPSRAAAPSLAVEAGEQVAALAAARRRRRRRGGRGAAEGAGGAAPPAGEPPPPKDAAAAPRRRRDGGAAARAPARAHRKYSRMSCQLHAFR